MHNGERSNILLFESGGGTFFSFFFHFQPVKEGVYVLASSRALISPSGTEASLFGN